MSNIFLNGLSSKAGGGKSILNNYLGILKNSKTKHKYFVLTPKKEEYKTYSNEFIEIIDIGNIYKNNFILPFSYKYILPKILNELKIDIVFNLADLPVAGKVPQVFLFDWAYAVYPESIVWKMMDFKSLIVRRMKLYYFKKYLKYVTAIIAQTETIKRRLENFYSLKNVTVVSNAVSIENLSGGENFDFKLPGGVKLLYLTYYYPNKNIEIFIPLAKEIKKRGLNYKIIVTIDPSQHVKAKMFLDIIKSESLNDVVINVGPVKMENVPSIYDQCDGLLMPTLLESFSGTYVEAMYHKLPILTSDMDFARDLCKNSAVYFDPFDVNSILGSIKTVFENDEIKFEKIEEGSKILNQLPDWNQVFSKYNKVLETVLNGVS